MILLPTTTSQDLLVPCVLEVSIHMKIVVNRVMLVVLHVWVATQYQRIVSLVILLTTTTFQELRVLFVLEVSIQMDQIVYRVMLVVLRVWVV